MNFWTLTILFFVIGLLFTGEKNTQFIRIMDVFIYGPALLYVAYKGIKKEDITNELYYLLIFMGATTISYNLKRFIIVADSNEINSPA
jgi:hypothetical protein